MSDQLFKKRQAKESYIREKKKRELYKALIVCEDSKSAPNYFKKMCASLKLNTETEIHITGNCGSDPLSVYIEAERLSSEKPYSEIFCVIDRDQHTNYESAIALMKSKGFKVINSVICFEIWLLFHYTDSSAPYQSCEELVSSELFRKYFPNYDKADDKIYNKTKSRIAHAISNTKKINKMIESSGGNNPYTKVVDLVEYLQRLKCC